MTRVLRLSDDQYNKVMLAVEAMANISIKRVEDYIHNDPNYVHRDIIHQQLIQHYNDWGNLRDEIQGGAQ